ncbi:hypothetical protein OPIT5_27705 [Opitutaceae bacterium TAV5]|nr:hypothetical protein OPIT5_27705 [Opitutaceae bacterium TAV5]
MPIFIHPSLRRPRCRAFTLIELLVVIVIIGVLAAIILPVLGSVRQQARIIKSLSNLRQIALGQQLFANANNDYFAPGQYDNYNGASVTYWMDYLDAYIDTDRPQGERAEVYQDPAALKGSAANPPTYALIHYSMNQAVVGSRQDADTGVRTSAFSGRPVVPASQIERPSQTILVVTGVQDPVNGNAAASIYGNGINFNTTDLETLIPSATVDMGTDSFGGIAYRLKDSAGAGMVDCSVRKFKRGTITYGNLLPW